MIASSEDRLPAVCNTVISIGEVGATACLRRPQQGEKIDGFLLAGMSQLTAREHARTLARFEDPELDTPGLGLPDVVPLPALLGLGGFDPEAIRRRWSEHAGGDDATGAIGIGEDGPVRISLLHEPHAMIGGTTGSGKSELLRTLVLSMASESDPERLAFVLIDYKGESTFAALGRLPHTVGLATNLDGQLTERALTCLSAELEHRARLFGEADGAIDLKEYRAYLRRGGGKTLEPLPHLVVIIDEFTEMSKKLPDAMSKLEEIARKGRALGVHLFLATQNPGGSVNAEIRSNTDLKISLRVQNANDSTDVIGIADAAAISEVLGGRAYIQRASSPPELIQTAFATGSPSEERHAAVTARRFAFARGSAAQANDGPDRQEQRATTDLTRLVDAINAAYEAADYRAPRRPWTDPLAPLIPLEKILSDYEHAPGRVPIATLDDPEGQAQYPWCWDLHQGNLLLYGINGSGTTSALAAIAIALASTYSPEELHLYVIDYGAGELAPLSGLPHVGSVVGAADRQRQIRLVRRLRSELEHRKNMDSAARSQEPRLVALVDNFAAFNAEFGDLTGLGIADELERVYADGPELGIHLAITADRAGAIRNPMTTVTKQKLIFHLSDVSDYGLFGLLRGQVPASTPGRAVALPSRHVIQVGWPGSLESTVDSVAARATPARRQARPVEILPEEVDASTLLDEVVLDAHPWRLPIGIADSTLLVAGFQLFEGDHVVVAGPPRAGKSSVLEAMAFVAKHSRPEITVIAIALRGSPLRDARGVDHRATSRNDVAGLLDRMANEQGPQLVLIDDADALEDADGRIARILAIERADLHIAIAARPDALRGLYGHWTQAIRRSRLGLLLKPDTDLDGDLLGVVLPRRQTTPATVGRGYLVCGGEIELVQSARVTD